MRKNSQIQIVQDSDLTCLETDENINIDEICCTWWSNHSEVSLCSNIEIVTA